MGDKLWTENEVPSQAGKVMIVTVFVFSKNIQKEKIYFI